MVPKAGDSPPSNHEKFNILLAEDYPANQLMTSMMLKHMGLGCVVAEDGEQALCLLRKQEFDLVLMDVKMPIKNGIETTRELRQWEATRTKARSVPIIGLTAYSDKEDEERCLSAGMNAVLTKPFTRWQLQGMIEQYKLPT